MGVEFMGSDECVAMYCNTSDVAFGPLLYPPDGGPFRDAHEFGEVFLRWLPRDPRAYKPGELERALGEFVEASSRWARCPECDELGERPTSGAVCDGCAEGFA